MVPACGRRSGRRPAEPDRRPFLRGLCPRTPEEPRDEGRALGRGAGRHPRRRRGGVAAARGGGGRRSPGHAGVAVLRAVVAPAHRGAARTPLVSEPAWELTTVADDLAVAFRGTEVRRYEDLEPGTAYEVDGMFFTTLPRPPGARLATVATVNDVHFGEEAAGIIDGSDIGPILRSEPGQPPYPEVMNRAAVVEIAGAEPDVVVAKGD